MEKERLEPDFVSSKCLTSGVPVRVACLVVGIPTWQSDVQTDQQTTCIKSYFTDAERYDLEPPVHWLIDAEDVGAIETMSYLKTPLIHSSYNMQKATFI